MFQNIYKISFSSEPETESTGLLIYWLSARTVLLKLIMNNICYTLFVVVYSHFLHKKQFQFCCSHYCVSHYWFSFVVHIDKNLFVYFSIFIIYKMHNHGCTFNFNFHFLPAWPLTCMFIYNWKIALASKYTVKSCTFLSLYNIKHCIFWYLSILPNLLVYSQPQGCQSSCIQSDTSYMISFH